MPNPPAQPVEPAPVAPVPVARAVAVAGSLLLALAWGLLALVSYPIIVIADSDLGAGAMQRVRDAGGMSVVSIAAAVLACSFAPRPRLRIVLAVALLILLARWTFESDSIPTLARWPGMALVVLAMVADHAEARQRHGRPLPHRDAAALALLLPCLLLLSDWRGRVYFGRLPSGSVAPVSERQRMRASVSLMAGDFAAGANSTQSRLKAAGGKDGAVTIQGIDGGPPLRLPATAADHVVQVLTFSPDGTTLAVGDNGLMATGSAITVWDFAPGGPAIPPSAVLRHTLRGPTHATFSLDFFPDGRSLVSANGDNSVTLWDLTTGRPQATFIPHHRADGAWDLNVDVVAAAPDGHSFATWASDGIKLWDRNSMRLVRFMSTPGAIGCSLAFTPDGRRLIATDRDATHAWDIRPSPVPFVLPITLTAALVGWLLLDSGVPRVRPYVSRLPPVPRRDAAA